MPLYLHSSPPLLLIRPHKKFLLHLTPCHKTNLQRTPLAGRVDSSSSSSSSFDPVRFEADRLRLDAEARESMVSAAGSSESAGDRNAWKWTIRKRVWDLMERENIAVNPRPVHHRIPNFVGAANAAELLGKLEAFQKAQCVKVNPDSPQKQVRFLTLTGGKKLLTPQPRLRTGFFSMLQSQILPPGCLNEACTSVGVAKFGRPIGLDERLTVDLIVIGSVAVDPNTGARLGKGEVCATKALRLKENDTQLALNLLTDPNKNSTLQAQKIFGDVEELVSMRHKRAEEEDVLSKLAKVELLTTGLVSGVVPRPLGFGYPPPQTYGAVPPFYNAGPMGMRPPT